MKNIAKTSIVYCNILLYLSGPTLSVTQNGWILSERHYALISVRGKAPLIIGDEDLNEDLFHSNEMPQENDD